MTNEERTVADNEIDTERSERDPESGEECRDVNFTDNGEEPPIDLEWGVGESKIMELTAR